jgi:hypothetical protein
LRSLRLTEQEEGERAGKKLKGKDCGKMEKIRKCIPPSTCIKQKRSKWQEMRRRKGRGRVGGMGKEDLIW